MDIPGIGIDLGELDLMRGNGLTVSVENEESGTGSSLVNRPDEGFRLLHGYDWRGGPNGLQSDCSVLFAKEERS
jgi:hypothetical protein